METLNVLTFIKYLPDDIRAGGGEITMWNTVRGLSERGHKISAVICNPDRRLPCIPNVEYYITPPYRNRRPLDFKTSAYWLSKSIKIKPDIIHSFYAESFATNFYGHGKSIPVVQEIHYADLYPYTFRDMIAYPKRVSGFLWACHLRIAKIAAGYADVVVTPSRYMKTKLIETFNLSGEKIVVIPVGVNEDVFTNGKIKNRFDRPTRLLFVGRLVKEKGLDTLLQAFSNVLKTDRGVYLTIIGDGPLRGEYETLARKLSVQSNTRFIGWITREKVLDYVKNSHMLIVPSVKENFPRITLEAMGAGIPVIASSVGGIPEQITDGVDGVIIPPENPQKLANAILSLFSKPEKMMDMSREGVKTAATFTIKRKIESFEGLYRRIISS